MLFPSAHCNNYYVKSPWGNTGAWYSFLYVLLGFSFVFSVFSKSQYIGPIFPLSVISVSWVSVWVLAGLCCTAPNMTYNFCLLAKSCRLSLCTTSLALQCVFSAMLRLIDYNSPSSWKTSFTVHQLYLQDLPLTCQPQVLARGFQLLVWTHKVHFKSETTLWVSVMVEEVACFLRCPVCMNKQRPLENRWLWLPGSKAWPPVKGRRSWFHPLSLRLRPRLLRGLAQM